MFDTLLIITLFLLASLLVCLLTLRLSINVKHLRLIFHSLLILTVFLKLRPPPFILNPRLLNLTKISDPPFILTSPFMRHLRVTHSFPMHPLKTSQNHKVVLCFQRVEKGCIGNEWINAAKNLAARMY